MIAGYILIGMFAVHLWWVYKVEPPRTLMWWFFFMWGCFWGLQLAMYFIAAFVETYT